MISSKGKRAVQPVKRLMFEQVDNAPKKKRRVHTKAKATANAQKKAVVRTAKGRVTKPVAGKKIKEKKEKIVKAAPAKKPKWLVKSHPSMKVINSDPFFSSNSLASIPFVSTDNYSKLVITAVLTKNKKMLQTLLADKDKVSTISIDRSVDVSVNALGYAIQTHNIDMIKMLFQAYNEESAKKRAPRTQRILYETSTGRYNVMALGIARIRKLHTARGSREGNNAFTRTEKDSGLSYSTASSLVLQLMEHGGTGEMYDTIRTMLGGMGTAMDRKAKNYIYVAVRWGNRNLAEHLLEKAVEDFQFGFGQLHYRVLSARRAEDLPNFRATSVTKKCHSNNLITPLHCACINPNEAILARLLAVFPEFSISDKQGWRPVHYAAACESPKPLQLLLKRGVNAYEMTSSGEIALHVAAEKGRPHNVAVLLQHAEDARRRSKAKLPRQNSKASQRGDSIDDDEEADLSGESKFGLGSINRPTRNSFTALHLAAKRGNKEVVLEFLKYASELNINQPLSATKYRLTPLMLAAEAGHMEVARVLLGAGGFEIVDTVDKLRRTALILAARNGHTHVMSLLLSFGANHNQCDSSGNSVLHYAAAYGWYYGVNMLLERGADPNAASDWKSTPLSVAFMNGHVGIVRMLLKLPTVDVNFVSDSGTTLIMMACRSQLQKSLVDQIKTLVEELKARCDIVDADGNTALHHLANNAPKTPMLAHVTEMDASLKIAQLLLSAGVNATAVNDVGYNALNLALLRGNSALVELLVAKGVVLSSPDEPNKMNVMHPFCSNYPAHNVSAIFQPLLSSPKNLAVLKKLMTLRNENGATPLHEFAFAYAKDSKTSRPSKPEALKFGVELLQCLIFDLHADVNAQVINVDTDEKVTKLKTVPERPTEKRSQFYTNTSHAWPLNSSLEPLTRTLKVGQTPLLFLALADDDCAALNMLEKHSKASNINLHIRFHGRCLLHDVVRAKRVDAARSLIRMGANVNCVSENEDPRQLGETPLMLAVKLVNLPMVELLLDHGADVTETDNFLANTALHYACCIPNRTVDSEKIVRILVEHSPRNSVRQLNHQDRTPLHLAANFNKAGTNSSAEVEEYLLSKGADLMAADCRGRVPLHYAFCKIANHTDTSNIDPIELCQTLVTRQAVDMADKFGSRPLHYAAIRGATVCAQYLLQTAPQGCIDHSCNNGNTALGLAVLSKQLNTAMALVQMKANLNIDIHLPVPEKKTPKVVTWKWVPSQAVGEEIERRRSLFNCVLRNEWQGLAYILADRLPNEGISREAIVLDCLRTKTYRLTMTLLRRWSDVGSRNGKFFHTFVKNALCDSDASTQLRLAEILLERKALPNERDSRGPTPLTKALQKHNYHLARFFIENCGVDPNSKDGLGRTAVIATFYARPKLNEKVREWLKFLHGKGVSMNQLGDLPVHQPLWHLHCDPPRNYFAKTSSGSTVRISPLIDSIRHHRFDMARALLLEFGADPNFSDSDGCSPLMHAVAVNDEKMVRLLLDHNYDGTDKAENAKGAVANQSTFNLFGGKNTVGVAYDDEDEDEEDDKATPSSDSSNSKGKVNPVDPEIPEDFPMVVPCSTLDLSRVDRVCRWTVLHHIVAPTPIGTFDNARLLRLLVHAGASLAHASELLKLAHDRRARVTMKTVQYLINRPKHQWEYLSDAPMRILKDADIPRLPHQMNAEKDYKNLLAKFEAEVSEKESVEKYTPTVDERCQAFKGGALVFDDRCGQHFDITLHKIAVEHGAYGVYNFYKLQLVHQRTKNIYFLFTCWGRIGDTGQYQNTPFPDQESAIKEFEKVFSAKTGNKWLNLAKFEEKPKKYGLMDLDKAPRPKKTENLPIDLETKAVSRLDPELAKTFGILFNVADLQSHKLTAKNLSSSYQIPFGRVKRENLEKAASILKEIAPLAAKICNGVTKFTRSDPASVAEKLKKDSAKLASLSNQYYTLVPQTEFVFTAIEPLIHEDDISNQLDMLTRLMEMHHIGRLVLAAQVHKAEMHPFDYIYRAIGCSIDPLVEKSQEAQILLQYAGQNVEQIYRIERPGEEKRCLSGKGPRKLLWHGTHPYNVPSILQHGLLIAPPGIDRAGALFGKGIYFADNVAKSLNYATSIGKENRKFLFLCEVDVDGLAEDEKDQRVKGGRFIRGGARPKSHGDFILPDGCIIPLGRTVKQGWYSDFSQYVIFEEDRVRLRYLVQIVE